MTTHRQPRPGPRHLVAGLLAAAVTASASAASVRAASPVPPPEPRSPAPITVTDPGATNAPIDLTPVGRVGQTVVYTMTLSAAGNAGFKVDEGYLAIATAEVVAARPDGSTDQRHTYREITPIKRSRMYQIEKLQPIIGVPMLVSEDANAQAISTGADPAVGELNRKQLAALQRMADPSSTDSTVFPAEPVGVGATWTVSQMFLLDGFELAVDYHYTLTKIENGRFTVDVTYAADAKDAKLTGRNSRGIKTRGPLRGSIQIEGPVADPSMASVREQQTIDFTFSRGRRAVKLQLDVDSTTEAAAPPTSGSTLPGSTVTPTTTA